MRLKRTGFCCVWMLDTTFVWWILDGGYEIRLVESGPHISLGACVLLTPLVCQQLKPNTQSNHGLINVFEGMYKVDRNT